jgi:hypothetical protein
MTIQEQYAVLFVCVLFLGILGFLELGLRVGRRTPVAESAKAGLGVLEGAMFALLGLLVAFTFSGAASRFEARRHLIVEEANDIGTAYLRVDLLPAEAQPEIRDLFRRYVDSRIETFHNFTDLAQMEKHVAKSQELQNEIWQKSVAAAARSNNTAATMLVIPALNAMIDITTTRVAATENHPPMVIFAMLAVIAMASALMAGFEMGGSVKRSWLHIVGYAVILSISVYVIIDLEFPRRGLIRVDAFDHYIVDVRNSMK